MWGPGAIIHILNILPFISIPALTVAFKRYNFLGVNPIASTRNYYKKWWVRVFFGRLNIVIFSGISIGLLPGIFVAEKNKESSIFNMTGDYLHSIDKLDEEISQLTHRKTVSLMYVNKMKNTRDQLLKERAKISHDKKIEAFNKLALALNH